MASVLIADDQLYIRTLLSKELKKEGHLVTDLDCVAMIWECIKTSRPDLVLLGLRPDSYDCWEILRKAGRKVPNLPILIYVISSLKDVNCLKHTINEVLGHKRFPSDKQFCAHCSF